MEHSHPTDGITRNPPGAPSQQTDRSVSRNRRNDENENAGVLLKEKPARPKNYQQTTITAADKRPPYVISKRSDQEKAPVSTQDAAHKDATTSLSTVRLLRYEKMSGKNGIHGKSESKEPQRVRKLPWIGEHGLAPALFLAEAATRRATVQWCSGTFCSRTGWQPGTSNAKPAEVIKELQGLMVKQSRTEQRRLKRGNYSDTSEESASLHGVRKKRKYRTRRGLKLTNT